MTRRYERENGKMYTIAVYPGNDNAITVTCDGMTKTVKIVNDLEFTYKLQKTQIKAKNAAPGLFKFIDDCLYNHFMECSAWKILDYIMDDMKSY